MEAVSEFKDRYQAILQAYRMTPTDLAELLNESIAKFYKYKDGTANPRKQLLERMLVALPDLSRDYLFKGVGPIKISPKPKKPVVQTEDGVDWKSLYEELKAYSDKRISTLEEANQELTQQHVELVRLFEGSPNQFTAYPFQPEPAPRMRVAGFGREPQNTLINHRFTMVSVGKRFYVAQVKRNK